MFATKSRVGLSRRGLTNLLGVGLSLLLVGGAVGGEPIFQPGQSIPITETFNGQPFSVEVIDARDEGSHTLYRLRYPSVVSSDWAPNNTIPAEFYIPQGMDRDSTPRPAVLCMHILDGNFGLVRMTCSMLAQHGIPAIMFKLPYYGERGFPDGPRALADKPALFVDALAQAVVDVRRTIDVIQAQPNIDDRHIGITGISLGGIVSATAAGLDPRIDRALLVLAGGDLRAILHHAEETEQLSQRILALPETQRQAIDDALAEVEPLNYASRLRPRAEAGRVMMINATEDATIPRECTERLAQALGLEDQVVWLDGLGHYTAMASLPRILERSVDFFGQDLPPDVEIPRPAVDSQSPHQLIVGLLRQLVTLFTEQPGPGLAHSLDLHFTAVLPSTIDPSAVAETYGGSFRMVRGDGERLLIEADIPEFGRVRLGQADFPWMVTDDDQLLLGTGGADTASTIAGRIDPNHLLNVRMITGAATALSMAPNVLNQMVQITDETTEGGPRTLLVMANDPTFGGARLVFEEGAVYPREIPFRLGILQGTIWIDTLATNTAVPEAVFAPPNGPREKEVDRSDLQRVFASLLNFAGDQVFLPPPEAR